MANLMSKTDMLEGVYKRMMKKRPDKFSTMAKKYGSGGMGFYSGFEKAAGISPGNLKAIAETAKRMKPKKPAGTVDLGSYWKDTTKKVPTWKQKMQNA